MKEHIRNEANEQRVRPDARDLPNVVELGEMPSPVDGLFARFPAIENRHACAVFFHDMARCFDGHLTSADRDGLYRTLDGAEVRATMDFFKKEFPRHAIGSYRIGDAFKRYRIDLYQRYLLALHEVRALVDARKVPEEAVVRFMDTTATLIDGIRRAKLP